MHLKEKFQKSKIDFQNVKKLTVIVVNKVKEIVQKMKVSATKRAVKRGPVIDE